MRLMLLLFVFAACLSWDCVGIIQRCNPNDARFSPSCPCVGVQDCPAGYVCLDARCVLGGRESSGVESVAQVDGLDGGGLDSPADTTPTVDVSPCEGVFCVPDGCACAKDYKACGSEADGNQYSIHCSEDCKRLVKTSCSPGLYCYLGECRQCACDPAGSCDAARNRKLLCNCERVYRYVPCPDSQTCVAKNGFVTCQ